MPESTFFEFTEGAFPDGTPRPLFSDSLQVAVPTMLPSGELIQAVTTIPVLPANKVDDAVGVRIIPGTRFIEVTNPVLHNALLAYPGYVQIDPPKKAQIDRAVSEMADDTKRAQALLDITAQQEETAQARGLVTVPELPTEQPDSGEEA